MTLKEYIKLLKDLIKDHPKAADAIVVYSKDEEGNHFEPLNFGPSYGKYEDGEFTNEDDDENNAICVN